MKTYAHIDPTDNNIYGIGMIYYESGELIPEIAMLVAEHGEDVGIRLYGEKVCPHLTDPVTGTDLGPLYQTTVIDTSDMPENNGPNYDKTFRAAWRHVPDAVKKVHIDVPKAKEITHAKRRVKRAAELAPLDDIIAKQIPGKPAADAEAARQVIRDKHAALQIEIDACVTTEQLKGLIIRDVL